MKKLLLPLLLLIATGCVEGSAEYGPRIPVQCQVNLNYCLGTMKDELDSWCGTTCDYRQYEHYQRGYIDLCEKDLNVCRAQYGQ